MTRKNSLQDSLNTLKPTFIFEIPYFQSSIRYTGNYLVNMLQKSNLVFDKKQLSAYF